MVTVEEMDKTENGLDFLIKSESGDWLAWAYSKETAQLIADTLNSVHRDADGILCLDEKAGGVRA